MKMLHVLVSALPLVIAAGTVMAGGSFSGNYQVKLTHDVYPTTQGYTGHGPDSTHCLAISDDSSVGWPHSGYVLLDGQNYGQFAVIRNQVLIYIDVTGSGQEPASLTFSVSGKGGAIAKKGAYDLIQGGYSYDAADAAFAKVSSC